MMPRSVVHNDDGFWLWIPTAVMQQLSYKVLKQITVCWSLVYSPQHDAILCVCWKDVLSFPSTKFRRLYWGRPFWRPPLTLVSRPPVTARLVNKDKLMRLILRYAV